MGDKRILIGNNGSEYGFWVSKTGTDVTTAGDHDLLFDSSRAEASLIIKSGAATGNTWYSWGSTLNYIPLIFIWQGKNSYPVRRGIRRRWVTGGRYGNTYDVLYEYSEVYSEATTTQYRVVGDSSVSYRFAAFSIGGSTIYTAGP
jgi:hypothetical protein